MATREEVERLRLELNEAQRQLIEAEDDFAHSSLNAEFARVNSARANLSNTSHPEVLEVAAKLANVANDIQTKLHNIERRMDQRDKGN